MVHYMYIYLGLNIQYINNVQHCYYNTECRVYLYLLKVVPDQMKMSIMKTSGSKGNQNVNPVELLVVVCMGDVVVRDSKSS
jgi:hypothetical protein